MRPALTLAAILAASPGFAAEWTVRDLGATFLEAQCVEASLRAFDSFAQAFGAGTVRTSGWVVTMGDLQGQGHDAAITCATGSGRSARATLLVHSARAGYGRIFVADQIAQLWSSHASAIDKQYKSDLGLKEWRW